MMERSLKERVIGAAVLVLFVVLVVPVFLDGPPEEKETVSERMLLPGQQEQDTKTVLLERDRSVPIPASANETQAAEAQEAVVQDSVQTATVVEQPVPAPAVSTPEKSAEKVEEPTADASTTGMWAVQLGSFSDRKNAEKLAADLREQEFVAFLSKLVDGGGELHRVRIGPQDSRNSAEAMAAELLRRGHKGQVVPHP